MIGKSGSVEEAVFVESVTCTVLFELLQDVSSDEPNECCLVLRMVLGICFSPVGSSVASDLLDVVFRLSVGLCA